MRRGAVIAVAAVAAVLVAGGLGLWWSMTRTPSAEDAAQRYLHALSTGDFATIEDMLDPTLDPDHVAAIEAAFDGATELPSEARIEEITTVKRTQVVRATAELDGERRRMDFALTPRPDGWQLVGETLATVTVDTTIGDVVQIGAAVVPAGKPVGVLPSVYPVRAAPEALLSGTAEALALPDLPVEVLVEASVAPEATAQAQTQLDAYADACAATAASVPAHCGLRVPWAADLAALTSISFRIEEYPTVALGTDGTSFAATDGVIVATASGTDRAGAAASFTYRADDWALRGSVSFDDGGMDLAVH